MGWETGMDSFFVYILRCADGSFYVGVTDDIEERFSEHQHGLYDGYTKSRRPVRLVYCEDYPTWHEALGRERQLKGWSRAKKQALMRQDWLSLMRLSESCVRLRGLIFDDWGTDLGPDVESSFEDLRTIEAEPSPESTASAGSRAWSERRPK
jgi:predicted GIY-YIG superfamily endonuclease